MSNLSEFTIKTQSSQTWTKFTFTNSQNYSSVKVNISERELWSSHTFEPPTSGLYPPLGLTHYSSKRSQNCQVAGKWIDPRVVSREFLGTSFFESVISPYRHHGCLGVRKLWVFNTSDLLKAYSVESNR